jgi:hypothetical protein
MLRDKIKKKIKKRIKNKNKIVIIRIKTKLDTKIK